VSEGKKSIIEDWLGEYGKNHGQTGWTGKSGWLNINKKLMTNLISIVSGEFVAGKTYVISGLLKSAITESDLHIVIRRPGRKEFYVDVTADKNGQFYTEVVADTGGGYIISVEYSGRTKVKLKAVEVSLMVAVLELGSFERFVSDASKVDIASIHI
jgi:hypothetical protein